MTTHQWLGLAALIFIVVVAIYGFRQGLKVKPDPNRRNDDGLPPGGLTGLGGMH